MGIEIERKFLVKNDVFKNQAEAEIYHQGFLSTNKERIVRVRERQEFEYEIPVNDAEYIINEICKRPSILKKRYRIPWGDLMWEVDEFLNENEGLVIAEIELDTEDQVFDLPDWIGKEVTGNKKYYNAYLVKHPYTTWK
jgi:adenylate cyclase